MLLHQEVFFDNRWTHSGKKTMAIEWRESGNCEMRQRNARDSRWVKVVDDLRARKKVTYFGTSAKER